MRTTDRSALTDGPNIANATNSHLATPTSSSPWMSNMNTRFVRRSRRSAAGLAVILTPVFFTLALPAKGDDARGFLETVKKHATLTSTVPENGDQNPYAI